MQSLSMNRRVVWSLALIKTRNCVEFFSVKTIVLSIFDLWLDFFNNLSIKESSSFFKLKLSSCFRIWSMYWKSFKLIFLYEYFFKLHLSNLFLITFIIFLSSLRIWFSLKRTYFSCLINLKLVNDYFITIS